MIPHNQAILVILEAEEDRLLFQQLGCHPAVTHPLHVPAAGPDAEACLSAASVPFLVICNMNVVGEAAFGLRQRLLQRTGQHWRTTPLVYYTDGSDAVQTHLAYRQRPFCVLVKCSSFDQFCGAFQRVVQHWEEVNALLKAL